MASEHLYFNVSTAPKAAPTTLRVKPAASIVTVPMRRLRGLVSSSERTRSVAPSSSQAAAKRGTYGGEPIPAPTLGGLITGAADLVQAIARALPIDEQDEAALRRLTEAAWAKQGSRPFRR